MPTTLPITKTPLWFVSDLHLDDQTPAIQTAFVNLLLYAQHVKSTLFLLGDIFESWVGDDVLQEDLPWLNTICQALKRTTEICDVYVCTGNRDFLMGPKISQALGLKLLPEQTIIEISLERFVISHGDELCTDDYAYQAFRTQVRSPLWQEGFLQQDLNTRIGIAKHLREQSEQSKQEKNAEIMDVNHEAVMALLVQANVQKMIHGHTHRPQTHYWQEHSTNYERWVLPNWEEKEGRLVRGGYLSIDQGLWTVHDLT